MLPNFGMGVREHHLVRAEVMGAKNFAMLIVF